MDAGHMETSSLDLSRVKWSKTTALAVLTWESSLFVQTVALALKAASSMPAYCRTQCASSATGSSVKESGSSP